MMLQPAVRTSTMPPASALSRMRRLLFLYARLAQRQTDAEVSACELTVDDLDRATVRVYELNHHREPDTGALHVPALRGLALVEGFEDAAALLERNSRSRIRDIEDQLVAHRLCVNV